jgi:methylated-DNA-[protein]-cysteine S-methyltransferase
MNAYTIIDSPIGRLLLDTDGISLTGLYMETPDLPSRDAPGFRCDAHAGPLPEAARQLAEYFAGRRTVFDLPLAPHGTEFQRCVWQALLGIPYGATLSYGEQARRIGKPNASRAVGLANGRNPLSIVIPCHRVIGANGSLTGYGGGLPRKRWLLAHEGQRLGVTAPGGPRAMSYSQASLFHAADPG